MAGGYIIDPATGQAGVQTASGGFLPLPMSPDQLSAAGLPGPPGLPPAPEPGPDERLALNGPYDFRPRLTGPGVEAPASPNILSGSVPPMNIRKDFGGGVGMKVTRLGDVPDANGRIHLGDPNAAPTFGTDEAKPEMRLPTRAEQGAEAFQAVRAGQAPKADLTDLAEPAAISAPAPTSAADDPRLVQLAMEQAMGKGGGGGGPRKLGVAGETRKYTTFENPGGDPAKVAAAQEALGASDKYSEELAKSLTLRHEEAYQAQQGEYAARAGQMAAQQQRFEQQQAMLQDYQAKRDAAMQEAAQLKTPQMEDYWESRGTMANIATALSITLGGALQGLRGGSNTGLEMSNQAIDRWIAGQREQYQRAREKGNDLDNQYAKMVQRFGSENLAADHLREQAWTVRDGMLKSYAEKIGTPSALENYNQAMLQTEAQRAALQAQNSQGAAVEVEQKLSMQGGGGGGQDSVLKMLRARAEARKLLGLDKEGDAPKPSDLKELNQSDAALAVVDKTLNGVAPGEELPGIKSHNIFSRAFRSAADTVGGAGTASGILDTEEERKNAQNVDWMQKQIIHSLTGAGMSDSERADYTEMIRGARTTQDLRNIVNTIKQQNTEQRRLISGGKPSTKGPGASTFRPGG